MLATAYKYANDSILQGAAFAEVGGFVFSPEQFFKVGGGERGRQGGKILKLISAAGDCQRGRHVCGVGAVP